MRTISNHTCSIIAKSLLFFCACLIASPLQAKTNPHQTILEIITPLIAKSKQAGEKGQIYPDQMPVPPFVWNHPCDNKITRQLKAKRPENPNICAFLSAIKSLVTKAVCKDEKQAFQTLAKLAMHYQGFLFSESQSLYLEERSKTLGLNTPFYKRVKQIMNVGLDRSHEPQRLRRIKAAIERGDFKKAKRLTPAFAALCLE